MFDQTEYLQLASIVFRPEYPGYKPDVKELPNGDGKIDNKQYAHISLKNLAGFGASRARLLLTRALFVAHERAELVADALQVPTAFRPDIRYGALRVLMYPPNGMSHRHTDFSLFTVPCFRDNDEAFVRYPPDDSTPEQLEAFQDAESFSPGLHLGELGEVIGLGHATPHEVLPTEDAQLSMVYFAIPDWDAVIPNHCKNAACKCQDWPYSVKDWLNERMARSRTAFKAY